MKKLLVSVLVFLTVFSPCSSFADSEFYKFADITLTDASLGSLKTSLESVTGVKFNFSSGQLATDLEPPITFMGIPIYAIYASYQPLGSAQLSVCLTPYEIDGYNDGSVRSFDDGIYDLIRNGVSSRFGGSSRYFIHFFNGDFSDLSILDNAKSYRFDQIELPYLLNDTCAFMFRNAYSGAYIEIYRKNTSESYIITNATDQSLYGNVNVAFIAPTFTYYASDLELLVDEKAYQAFPLFPIFNGSMQYTKDF